MSRFHILYYHCSLYRLATLKYDIIVWATLCTTLHDRLCEFYVNYNDTSKFSGAIYILFNSFTYPTKLQHPYSEFSPSSNLSTLCSLFTLLFYFLFYLCRSSRFLASDLFCFFGHKGTDSSISKA